MSTAAQPLRKALAFALVASLAWADCSSAADEPVLPEGMQSYLDAGNSAWGANDELVKAVADGGKNWVELARALDQAASEAGFPGYFEATAWVIQKAPHLDRLEISAGMLNTNTRAAFDDASRLKHSTGSDFFRRYMLNYRLDDEPVTDWRGTLARRYGTLGQATGQPTVQQLIGVAKAVCSDFSVRERGYFGNLADPVSIDNSRAGTKREFALLTAAVFRSLGYATRFVRDNASGESWVEVYGGGPVGEGDSGYDAAAWLPVYPTAPEFCGDFRHAAQLCGGRVTVITAGDAFGREQVTAHYGPVAKARPVFLRGDDEAKGYEHWTLSAFSKGAWVPLDDLEYPSSDKDYPLDEPNAGEEAVTWYTLGAPGRYMFTCGARYPGGVVDVQTNIFDVEPEDHFEHYFGLDAPADLPPAAWVERSVNLPEGQSSLISAQGRYLYVVYDDSEPSVRAYEAFQQFSAMDSLRYVQLRRDTQDSAEAEFIGAVLGVGEKDALPVAVLVIDGRTALYTRGYNLNAADWVKRALASE